jgi:glutathione S-transferase
VATPLLWHFPISHYNEKARWALDYKGIPHRREVLSASYLPRAWWATGAGHLPILHLEDGAVGDSTAIIAALETRCPDPRLYPEDPALLERALALEDFFDEEIGHPVRTVLVGPLMTEGGAARTAEVMMRGMAPGVQRAFRVMHPIFSRFYFQRHGIHDESRSVAPDIVRSGFDRVLKEKGSSDYLVGDAFSVADLTAAALLAPLVGPEGTIWATLGDLPGDVARFADEIDRHEASTWVREMYRRHRGESAEITS